MADIEKKINYFQLYIFINLALYITYFQIENVNYFWFINNIFINIYIINYTYKVSKKILALFTTLVCCTLFFIFFESIKISSFIFTIFNLATAIIQLNYFIKKLNKHQFIKYLIIILYIFLITYLIQSFCVLFHIPIFNGFGLTKLNTTILRLNSFAPEPSMGSQLILILLYIINNSKTINGKELKLIEFFGITLILLYGSVLGYISLFLYIFVIHRKNYPKFFKFEVLFLSLIVFYFINKNDTFIRIYDLSQFLINDFDISNLANVEPSGGFRIYPIIFYFNNFDVYNYHYFTGFGPGTSSTFFTKELIETGYGLDQDSKIQGGFLPSFLIDYGLLISIVLFFFILKRCIITPNLYEITFIFFLFLNININTQLFWFFIFTTFLLKNFINSAKLEHNAKYFS